jgi:hypothetical protein
MCIDDSHHVDFQSHKIRKVCVVRKKVKNFKYSKNLMLGYKPFPSYHMWLNFHKNLNKDFYRDRFREDPRLQVGYRSRQSELHESKTLLRCWSHTWQK